MTCNQVELGTAFDCSCDAMFTAGDRVASLVDNPSGNADIVVGDLGTIVCGASWTETRILVDWDNLTSGHNGNDGCGCEQVGLPDESASGWFLDCTEIELFFCTGDTNGSGAVDIEDLLELIGQWGACSGSCTGDFTDDGVVGVDDLLVLISVWGECGSEDSQGACLLSDHTCEVMTESDCEQVGGLGWVNEGTCEDSDGDRIPNVFELGDCSAPAGAFSGSDSGVADTDGDGINDGDEVYGTLAGLELDTFGCNPCRYDLLVETDWVYATGVSVDRNKLHINQVNRIVNSFANAPVLNEDGTAGIKLHIDYGQSPYNNGNSVEDPSGNSTLNFDNWDLDGSEFQVIKDAHFDSNRHLYFHYCLMADAYSVAGVWKNSSGLAELPGDDFVTTMGQWALGDDDKIGNTMMHELGHNLDIRHGGFENRNWKPNYNSVMNYRHQFCGVDTDGDSYSDLLLDYSRGTNIDLNESSLNETVGVTGVGPAIDWNENGNANETNITRNINCEFSTWNCGPWDMLTRDCGSGADCYDSSCDIVSDYNDWLNISYSGLAEADFKPREIIHCILE